MSSLSLSLTTMAADAPMHPYYPLSASIPAYVANESSVLRLVTTFVVLVGLVAGLAYWSAIRTPSSLRPIDKFAVVWFAVCESCLYTTTKGQLTGRRGADRGRKGGWLHVGFEGKTRLDTTRLATHGNGAGHSLTGAESHIA